MDPYVPAVAVLSIVGALAQGVIQRAIARRKRAVPLLLDPDASDGGAAACMAMVFAYHLRPTSPAAVRTALAAGGAEITPQRMIEVAREHGFDMKPRIVPLEDHAAASVRQLPRGTILRTTDRTFVVFDRIVGNRVTLHDPATGQRRPYLDELCTLIDGIALVSTRGFRVSVPAARIIR